MIFGLFTIYKKIPENFSLEFLFGKHGTGRLPFAYNFRIVAPRRRTDRLRFDISDSPVNTSAAYKMKENMLQKI